MVRLQGTAGEAEGLASEVKADAKEIAAGLHAIATALDRIGDIWISTLDDDEKPPQFDLAGNPI